MKTRSAASASATSSAAAPTRASSRDATTCAISGTGAITDPASSATKVRSTSDEPSPPASAGSAIDTAPIPTSRFHSPGAYPAASVSRTSDDGHSFSKKSRNDPEIISW